ncbi:hypothetical protein AX15_006636, partial [Amanita polypyramis BW_CC]
MSSQPSSSQAQKFDCITWAPMPQIASIEEIPSQLAYPSSSSSVTDKNKNKSRPPPLSDCLTPYEDTSKAEVRGVQRPVQRPLTTSYASVASANTQDWQIVMKKKAMANGQHLLNHFKLGLHATGHKLLMEILYSIEQQDNHDIILDKVQVTNIEWTPSNALLLTADVPLSQDQQALLCCAVVDYLQQEVNEVKLLNCQTTSSLKFCKVRTHSIWDGKVISDDDLLRAFNNDKIWKNVTIFGKLKWIKPRHLNTLPPIATILVKIKDLKKGEDAKVLLGTVVTINGQPSHCLPWIFNETIPQCKSCLCWGHTMYTCQTTFLTCVQCGDNHPMDSHVLYCGLCLNSQNCNHITCVNCRGNSHDDHSALDINCPFCHVQNNADAMHTLMEGYREHKAIWLEINAKCHKEEHKTKEALKKKGGKTL